MKQLISLLIIISITAMSWSSCAKNKAIEVTTIQTVSYTVSPSSFLAPTISTLQPAEGIHFPQTNVINENNRFFELSIRFNDKLQQIISFFTRSSNETGNAVENNFHSLTSKEMCQKTVNAMLYL